MSGAAGGGRTTLSVTLWFMAMECAWMAVVLGEMAAARSDHPPVLWTLALYPAAWIYGRIEARQDWRPWLAWLVRWSAATLAVAAVALWVAGIPPLELPGLFARIDLKTPAPTALTPMSIAAAAAVLAALRGYVLSQRQVDREGFAVAFQVGVVILLVTVFIHQVVALPDPPIIAGLTAFLGIGLFGLWLCGWQESEIAGRTGETVGWPTLALAGIAAVMAVGAGLWSLLDAETMQLLLAPVFWLWGALFRFLAWLFSLLPAPDVRQAPPPLPGAPEVPPIKDHPFLDLGETVRRIAGFIFLTSVAALFGAALLRNLLDLLRWLARRSGRAPGVAYERTTGSLLDDLKEGFAALVHLFRRWYHALLDRLGLTPRNDPLPPEARAVRNLYARLLGWAASRGVSRAIGETPHEFLAALRASLVGGGPELAAITEAYAAVRYADVTPDPATVRDLRSAWRKVRKYAKPRPKPKTEPSR